MLGLLLQRLGASFPYESWLLEEWVTLSMMVWHMILVVWLFLLSRVSFPTPR